jgi:hypothetical protein
LTGEYNFEIIIPTALLTSTQQTHQGDVMGTGNTFGQGMDADFLVQANGFACRVCSAFDGKIVFHSSANSRDKFSCNNCTNLFLDPVKHCKSGLTDLVCVSNPKVTEYLRKEFLRE